MSDATPHHHGLKAAALAAGLLAIGTPALADDTPVTGGTLVYLEQQAHTNIYPPSAGFYPNGGIDNQITDKLTYQDPRTLKILPWLAESWTVNADATQYTFKIRHGVTFSDGTPLDATAVARNFDVYGRGDKALKLPVSEVINNYDHSQVVDPQTVTFFFKKPSPGFLQGTSVIGSGIVSLSTLARRYDELGQAPNIIGSGPFVVANEVLGKQVDLKVRPDYNWAPPSFSHQGRAYLDAISIIVTPEDSVRIGSLTSGQGDVIRQVQAFDEAQVSGQGFQIYAAPTRGVNDSVAFRPDNPLVADLHVRQALLHATNAQEIVETLFSANYPKATAVISSVASGYEDFSSRLAFDPALSAMLLDEAGWTLGSDGVRQRQGKPLELAIHVSIPQPQNQAVLQLLAQQWARVGVKLDVLSGSAGNAVTDNLDPLKTPLVVAEVGRADPDVIKSQFHPANRDALLQKGGSSSKVDHFVDPKLNGLLEAVAAEVDPAKRIADAKAVQDYILDQAYDIPFFEEPQVFAGAPYVHGLGFEAVGRPRFYDTWLAPH